MTLKPAPLLFALIAAFAAPAFAQNLAVVNGKPIPTSRVDAIVKQLVASGEAPDSPQLRDEIKQGLIQREVMMQEAMRLGFDKKPDVKAALDSARQAIVVNQLARDYIAKHPVTDAEIKAEYDRYAKGMANEKEYHLRHILLATEDEAKAVIAKLKGGAKFEDLVKQSKDAGTANTGGDLDWQPSAMFPPEFVAVLAKVPKGGVADTPLKGSNGFHVFKIDDTRAVTVQKFEQLKPQIADRLAQSKLAAYQDEMVKKAKVQ